MKANNLKNSSLNTSLSSSNYVSFKKSEKRRRKKNSYTDKYIDKKKFRNELVEIEKSKKLLRSGDSQKSLKKIIYKDLIDANGKNNYINNNKFIKTDYNKPNRQVLKKNHSYQHYNIKFHFFPKKKRKIYFPN